MSWIFFTISAVILQTFRNLEQKNLNKRLDEVTVSWSRFILPLPLAISIVIYHVKFLDWFFVLLCLITALFQIAGNIFLLKILKSRNFGIGIAFYKTEVIQSAIIGIFLGYTFSVLDFASVIITTLGMILMLNFNITKNYKTFDQSSLFGALSGFCFSISAFSLKFATEYISAKTLEIIESAILVLMLVIILQNIFFISLKRSKKTLKKDLRNLFNSENKYSFFKTGILSLSGSICWFVAFALGNVVYIKIVSQLELLLAIAISHFYLHEKNSSREIMGIILTFIGILLILI